MARVVLALVLALAVTATAAAQPTSCAPTKADMLGPFYKPGAPERAATGQGLVISGIVRSAPTAPFATRRCRPAVTPAARRTCT